MTFAHSRYFCTFHSMFIADGKLENHKTFYNCNGPFDSINYKQK